jgi:hypothetical protein
LNLSEWRLSDVSSWAAVDGADGGSRFDSLVITFAAGSTITITDYYDDSSSTEDTLGAGAGHIETIVFADDASVDLAQVHTLA